MIVKTVVLLILVNYSLSVPVELQKRNTQQNQQPSNGCQLIQGPPGPPGPPGTFSPTYTEVKEFKRDIQLEVVEQINTPCTLGVTKDSPARSCYQIHQCNPKAPSQSYWLETEEGQITTIRPVYCNMDSWHCGSKGWTRIAYINMTEDGASCPDTFRQITSPKKLCTRIASNHGSCSSVTFPTHGMKFNKICGKAVGYQKGSTDGFHKYPAGRDNINSYYLEGVSITYGYPRKHIWSYVAGLSDDGNYPNYNCPCAKYPGPAPPSFVGDHYYCESGNNGRFDHTTVHINDPLWDGEGCGADNNCCAQPGMPWFCRTLPQEVEGDIEVRICADHPSKTDEDVYIELLEVYIQ